ncbi:ABC transporter substrate-binding protein [Microbacterium indicum]|uniref:ABC transporter substrate-binding protein n=1 Tax=Microbacterium indicum TaxID=358100 RepID=UPI00040CBAA0|nr:ABC transporter substrate-binding protein [Microbacterium indicum]
MKHRLVLASVAVVGSVALLAGCSSNTAAAGSAAAVEPSAAPPVDVPDGWTYVEGDAQPTAEVVQELPVTVTDGTGAEVEVDDTSRIIAAGDDVAEILGALGLADDVYAAPADGASAIARGAEVQYEFNQSTGTEGLLSVDGTLFIGNNPNRHGDVAQQFRDAGVDAVVYDDQQPTADKIRAVAEYVGAADAGEEIAAAVEGQLAEAASYADDLEGITVLQVTASGAGGANAVVGTGTAGADIAEAIGVTSVGVDAGLRGYSVEYSDEGLLATEPDAILVGTADLEEWGGLDGFVAAFPTLVDTPAFQNDRIFVMPSEQIKISGPALGVGAEALASALDASFSE